MKYYKVIKSDFRGFRSCFPIQDGTLFYSLGKWTSAIPGSIGIFIFCSHKLAKRFVDTHTWDHDDSPLEIFQVETRGPIVPLTHRFEDGLSFRKTFCFSKHLSRARRIRQLFDLHDLRSLATPPGTFSAQAVKLIKEV